MNCSRSDYAPNPLRPAAIPLARWLLLFVLLIIANSSGAQPRPALIPFTDGKLWGYADTLGTMRIPSQWAHAGFFENGRATVLVRRDAADYSRSVYARIDEGGNYVLPPQAGWNGSWSGSWGATGINAVDSSGRGGIIDPEGRLLMAYGWERAQEMMPPLTDSFKIVYRDGLAGIVNRAGQLVVPCKWGEIRSTAELSRLRAFLASDPDNLGGTNRFGIADVDNRIIIPTRYANVEPLRLADGRSVFRASLSASNEPANYNFGNYDAPGTTRFLAYPSGRRLELADDQLQVQQTREQVLPGGFINTESGALLDSARRVVVPCCSFWTMQGDTILTRSQRQIGHDSLEYIVGFIDKRTIRPFGPPLRYVIYHVEPEPSPAGRYGYSHRHSYSYDRTEATSISLPFYGPVTSFYKDSFLYRVMQRQGGDKSYFVVYAENRKPGAEHRHGYSAVVDEQLRYLLTPQKLREIRSYNTRDRLAIVDGYQRGAVYGAAVLGPEGQELMFLPRGTINEAFRWQGRVYAFIQVQDECVAGAAGLHTFFTDSALKSLPAFEGRDIVYSLQAQQSNPDALPAGAVWIRDPAGRVAAVYPDGSAAYPQLNFRYLAISRSWNGWFLVQEPGDRGRKLVTIDNRPLLPGLSVHRVVPAEAGRGLSPAQPTGMLVIPRLASVSATDRDGAQLNFYMDDTGRPYFKAP